jgi:hypothetical protein
MAVAVSPEIRLNAAKVRNETISMVANSVSTRLSIYFIGDIPSKKSGSGGRRTVFRIFTLHSRSLSSCYAV